MWWDRCIKRIVRILVGPDFVSIGIPTPIPFVGVVGTIEHWYVRVRFSERHSAVCFSCAGVWAWRMERRFSDESNSSETAAQTFGEFDQWRVLLCHGAARPHYRGNFGDNVLFGDDPPAGALAGRIVVKSSLLGSAGTDRRKDPARALKVN